MSRLTVYITIDNSTDRLTQARWSDLWHSVSALLAAYTSQPDGQWQSASTAPQQNACWCVVVNDDVVDELKRKLRRLASTFDQDAIRWAEATMELIPAE